MGEYRETTGVGASAGSDVNKRQNYAFIAITSMHSLWEKIPLDAGRLLECLPDTDGEGQPISKEAFSSRWQNDPQVLIKHLFSKHSGELIELSGKWEPGVGDVPELIHTNPQLALTARDAWKMTPVKNNGQGGNGNG